jgi:hypothetical protein
MLDAEKQIIDQDLRRGAEPEFLEENGVLWALYDNMVYVLPG